MPWTTATGKTEIDYLSADFRCRFPDSRANGDDDFAELKRLVDWVGNATDDMFREQIEQYFNLEYLIRYYLTVQLFGLIDNLGKNTMLTTFDGNVWYMQLYDCDSCTGLDNTGAMKFDSDIEVVSGVFNTSSSRLWEKLRRNFPTQILAQWEYLRLNEFTEENIMKYLVDNISDKIPEVNYNLDAWKKYINLGQELLFACHGNRRQQIQRWIKERIIYVDTLLQYTVSTNDYVTVRVNKMGEVSFDIQAFQPMYFSIKFRNETGGTITKRISRGETVRFSYNIPVETDQEILVYGGRFIKDLGDLSDMNPTNLLLGNATRLTKLKCTNADRLINASISGCVSLQEVDLHNCSNLGAGSDASLQTLDLSACRNLRTVDISGTQLTALYTSQQGGIIQEILYPYSIQIVRIQNQARLTSLGIPCYYTGNYNDERNIFAERLSEMTVSNCPNVKTFVKNYYTNEDGSEVPVPTFIGVSKGRTFNLSNVMGHLTQIDLSYCSNIESLTLDNFNNLTEINFDDIAPYNATTSNLHNLTLTNCPNVETLTFNQNTVDGENSLGVAFKEGTVLDLSGLYNLKHIRSNVGVKGLKKIILPLTILSLVFNYPASTTYAYGESDIEDIFSKNALHETDGFKGVDLLDIETITDFSMGSLTKINNAINLDVKITDTFPYINYFKTDNYFKPEGTIDISEYKGSLEYLFKGVDLDKLTVVCSEPLPHTSAKYMFAYASGENVEVLNTLFGYMPNVTDFSYMFYYGYLKHAPLIPTRAENVSYMFYNNETMETTPSNWLQAYPITPISDYCYTGCSGIIMIDDVEGSIDVIPVAWGGFDRKNVVISGETIIVEQTLEREFVNFTANGQTFQNIVPEVGQTPTLIANKSEQPVGEGMPTNILLADGLMPEAELEGFTLANLASEKRSSKMTCNQTENDIRVGLNDTFIIEDGGVVSQLELDGLTLVNIMPETGKTPLISNNNGTYDIAKGLDEGVILDTGKMLSSTLYGETMINLANKIDSNTFEINNLKANTNYTLRFDGSATSGTLGGSTINTVNDTLVATSATDNILYLDGDVSNVMLLEGNYIGRDIPCFTGMKSVEAIEVETSNSDSSIQSTIQLPPHIQLHSLPDGTRDEVDIKTGILIRRTQKIDNEIVALEPPTTEQLILNYNNSCDYGRILPTGMCDKYDVVNSMYTQTMTSILLDGANTWDAMEEMTNVIKFTATGTTVGVEELNMLGAGGLYCDNGLFPNINDDSDVEHCRVDEAGNKFYVYVDKERLMSPDLIGWQIWLQANNFNMVYELAEHLTYVQEYEELDPTQARWEGMDCMRDGAIKYHANNSDNITIYPTLEYVAPSINNFEVTMLEPNTDYTIYAEGINANDTINLGGTDINFNNGTVYTSGDNQWLRIDNNDSFYNMVITKGDTTGEVVPYFEGMTSVENPTIEVGTKGNLISTLPEYWEWNSVEQRLYANYIIRVKPNEEYFIFHYTSSGYLFYIAYDKDGNKIDGKLVDVPTETFILTIPKNCYGLKFGFHHIHSEDLDRAHLKQTRMFKGTVDLGYTQAPPAISSIVSYTNLKLRSLPNGVKDTINVVTGEYVQRVGEREYQDGDLTNENVLTDGINTAYELENPIITKLDPQILLAYTDGTINLSSDTGLLPTTHYTVPSTNTFNLPSMKTGTRYTLKYPSASGSITIGDINYNISSDSMLFTTPLKINGDTSAIIFSDNNPENVILLEGAYNKREVPFFTGVKSVKNPNITIIDQLSTESTTYNCATEIELRGLPNGIADKLDIIKGKLTTNVGIRPYQEGDENLPNIWTDGYETVYALSSPVVTNVAIDHPTVTTNSLIVLSSDCLIPQLNYRAPSSNNFPLDLLQPNQTYTLYADTLVSGSYTLGGTRTGIYSQPHTITLGDMTDNLLTFNGDLGLSNVMLVKGNSLKTTLPPYFLGIRSVIDGHLLVEGMTGETNEITFDEGIVLRDCNGVKDTIDLITCTLTKRTGEIVLTGVEGWSILPNTTINDDLQIFAFTLSGINSSINNGLVCDKFIHKHMSEKLQDTEAIYSINNQLRLVVKKSRIGGDTVNALKSWLNQNHTTIVYPLTTPLEIPLKNVWTTSPLTSYNNQTEISSTVSSTSLKPMISVNIATTTLEEIVSNLETQNEELENENVATMLALTNIYETFAMPMAINETSTINLSDGKDGNNINGMSVSPMGMIYAKLIKKGYKTIEQVPANLQAEVKYALKGLE